MKKTIPNNPATASRLEELPNIGPAMAADLRRIGINHPGQLAGKNAFVLYNRLCTISGKKHDPCVIDVFLSAIHYRVPRVIVIPAQAGIHNLLIYLDSGFRRSDEKRIIRGSLYAKWRCIALVEIHSGTKGAAASRLISPMPKYKACITPGAGEWLQSVLSS